MKRLFSFVLNYASYIITSVILGVLILLWAWPNFTGNYSGYIQTFNPPQEYKHIWNWLNNDHGDYRVLWLPAPYPTLYKGMRLAGYDAIANVAGKPVIYAGRWMGPKFVIYLIKLLYEKKDTEKLSRLFGISNIKYIVFDTNKRTTVTDNYYAISLYPEMKYTNEKLLRTLASLTKKGVLIKRNEKDGFFIYENTAYKPHLFPLNKIGLVAGNLESLLNINTLWTADLYNTGLIFVSQLNREDMMSIQQMPNSHLFMEENNYEDIVMSFVPSKYKFNPTSYYTTRNPMEGWTPFTWRWFRREYLASVANLSFTFATSKLTVPFNAEKAGKYEIFLQYMANPPDSSISIYLDDKKIGQYSYTLLQNNGMQWLNITQNRILKGGHTLVIKSNYGENALGSIAIVPSNVIKRALESSYEFLENKELTIMSNLRWKLPQRFVLHDNAVDMAGYKVMASDRDYSIKRDEFGLVIKKKFTQRGDIGEDVVLINELSDPVPIRPSEYFEFTYKIEDPAVQFYFIQIFVDSNGDQKPDIWIRLYPDVRNEGFKAIKRPDGITDIWVPQAPAKDSLPSFFKANLHKILASYFKEPKKYQVTRMDFHFEKMAGFDCTTSYKGEYSYHVRDWSIKKSSEEEENISGIFLNNSYHIEHSIFIPRQGFYDLYLRGRTNYSMSSLAVGVGSRSFLLSLKGGKNHWYKIRRIFLNKGLKKISFSQKGDDRIYIDRLILDLSKKRTNLKPVTLTFTKINPARYSVSYHSDHPFYLFFSEAYSPFWKINSGDSRNIKSYPAYSFGNIFLLAGNGKSTIELTFEREKYVYVGYLITLIIICIFILYFTWAVISAIKSGIANES